jgi:amidohydrolase
MQTLPFHEEIITFRQTLHQHPELSEKEQETARLVENFLAQFEPDCVISGVGGTGVMAVFNGEATSDGPTVLFRAELDALPIEDINDLPYKSVFPGTGHKCGHDGHMAILAGVASLLHQRRTRRGKVILLFQPAEENGAGALAILNDKRFQSFNPDYVFALHNLPGVPKHHIVIKRGVFAAASSGMVIKLEGKSSHAAEPENGINPALAVAEIIQAFNQIASSKENFKDLTLLTLIHTQIGTVAFGTNPGFATVMATLRAYQPADFINLKNMAEQTANRIAKAHHLKIEITFVEEFPATVNNNDAVNLIMQSAEDLKLTSSEAAVPFKWSEDFGHFTQAYKGALFGLGSGSDQPQLHHPDYDFPDEIISTGSRVFYKLSTLILNN